MEKSIEEGVEKKPRSHEVGAGFIIETSCVVRANSLLHQQHLLRGRELSSLGLVEVHT